MQITSVAIASLTLDPHNARSHSDKNLEAIKGSLTKFGQQKPIVINKNNVVVAGNGTVAAAQLLGWEKVACVVTELEGRDLTAYALADNRTAELAAWDDENLGKSLQELFEDGFDIASIGFDPKEFEVSDPVKDAIEDDIPEVPQNIHNVERGQIWQLGNHRLMCGDSTSKMDVEKLMNGEKADMVFTDPPYGMNLDVNYDSMFGANNSTHKNTGNRFKAVEGDDKDYDPSHIFEMFDCDKFLWGCDYYYDRLPKGGCFLAWDKRDENLDKVPGNPTEFCWSDKPRRRMSFRIKWSGHHGMQKDDTKTRVHPTQKPTALVEAFFEQWGKNKTIIADIFLGSGSTLIACEKTNRKCYGCEIDPHYCSVIIERYIKYVGSDKEVYLLDGENKTHISEVRKMREKISPKVSEQT